MEQSGQPTVIVVRRCRRTRRHQRNRSLRRAIFFAAVAGMLLGFWFSLIPEDFGSYLASFLPADHSVTIGKPIPVIPVPMAVFDPPPSQHDVYPYSLVPGGVRNVKELRDVFEHDPVLASHYRGFDFRRARVIHLMEDRTVYVSYRIAGKVYWTTRRIPLHAGEMLITDGVITIRTRCGNQVSVNPRQEVSPHEPNVALLDQPMRFFDPSSPVPPPPNLFESSMHRPTMPVFVSAPQIALAGGGPRFGFVYPPSAGVCGPGNPRRKPVYGGPAPGGGKKHKKGGNPCSTGGRGTPGEAPEPTSIILLSTGLGGIFFRYRKQRRSAASPALAQ